MRWERIRFIRGKTSHQNGMQGMMPELLGVLPCCRAPGRFRSSDGKWHMPWASKRSLSLPRLALATPSRGVEPMSAECRFSCPHCHIHISLFLGRLLPSNFLAMFTTRLSDPSADADVFMEIALVAIARRIRSFRACNIQIMMLLAPPFHAP